MANAQSQIEHIVVLMLENRSFDNMLGWQFGLDPERFNLSDRGEPIRYGVRIPNLLISPFIPAGSLVEPPGDVPFDHTSVIKTVRECFGLPGGPLTKRDAVAPSLADALTLDSSSLNLGPEQIPLPVYEPPREDVVAAANAPLTGFQKALLYGADCLPNLLEAPVYREALRAGIRPRMQPLPHRTPAEARPHVRAKLTALLGRLAGED
jgi:hypothetical protein